MLRKHTAESLTTEIKQLSNKALTVQVLNAYKGPGQYVAICNKANFDGHYVRVFEVPDEPEWATTTAIWYFLNVLDGVACVEGVYPLEVFAPVVPSKMLTDQEMYTCPNCKSPATTEPFHGNVCCSNTDCHMRRLSFPVYAWQTYPRFQ
jgi:hypothetical protein